MKAGVFSIEGIKLGEYDIVIGATHFGRVSVKLKVLARGGDRSREIVFGLEPGLGCCTGWVKVRKVK